MNKITLLLFVSILSVRLIASDAVKDTTWTTKYESTLGFSQTSFTNWTAGGENALALNGMLNIYKNYAKGKVSWMNYLGLAYGVNFQETDPKMRKTNDKINFLTKGGIFAWKNWDYTGLFEFRSQLAPGFNYPNDSVHISRFMAPGYFQLSIGLNYKPVDYFSVFISPIGARLTVVNDSRLTNAKDEKGKMVGAFGVIGDNLSLWQVGGSFNAVFKKDIMKNVNYMSKLDLFSDYRHNPLNIIVGWENNFLMKVNKYLSLSLTSMLIYDDNIKFTDKQGTTHGPRIQFRETFAFGFAYSLEHK